MGEVGRSPANKISLTLTGTFSQGSPIDVQASVRELVVK